MKTAAAYIRVSTEDQTEFSPDSQLKAIRRYASEHGLTLPEEFIFADEGISGRNADKRPAFQKMIGAAKQKPKPFDVILLWKFSRFARSRQDSIFYKSMLRRQCGIDVVSVSEQLSDDNTSVLIEALIEAMDEYYSLNLAEEVRRGMQEKFSRGGVVSQPPFGYRMGNGIFVPDEVNAPVVKMIFNDYIAGMGTRQIAARLNAMGIRSSKGNPFENRTVEYILTNPVYTGRLRRSKKLPSANDRFHDDMENTQLVNGLHEPLISDDMYELAQKKRMETKSLYDKYDRHAPAEFMLKGLVRCSACGATLTRQSAGNSIQCYNYSRGSCRISHSVTLKKINSLVTERIISDLKNGSVDIHIHECINKRGTADTAASMLAKEQKKLVRVREAYEAGIDSLEEYRQNKIKIQQRISELEEMAAENEEPEVPGAPDVQLSIPLNMLECPAISEAAKNLSLRSIICRIVLNRPKDTIEIFYKF